MHLLLSFANVLAFAIYLWLMGFVLYKNPKAKLNRVCALFISTFVIWSFCFAFKDSTLSKSEAGFWVNIASFGWCSFGGFALWFGLILAGREKILRKWFFYPLLFFIPALTIYKTWRGEIIVDYIKVVCGWRAVWASNFWVYLFYIYYISCIVILLYLAWDFGKKTKKLYEKKQAKIIFVTALISLIFGSLTDVLFPNLGYNFPPVGNLIVLTLGGGIVYAITKYKLMTLTPAVAADDIISAMSDALILIDLEEKIVETNDAAVSLLGYKKPELIDRPAEMIFGVKPFKELIFEKLIRKEPVPSQNILLKAKSGEEIPVSLSSSAVVDETGALVGIVCVAKDMRKTQRMIAELEVAKASLEEKVKERTAELEKSRDELAKKVKELERFTELALGREERIAELKEEIARLKEELARKK